MSYSFGMGWGRGRGGRGGRGGYGAGRGGSPWQSQQAPPLNLPPAPPYAFRIAAPVMDNQGVNSTIAPMLARAPMLAFVDVVNGKITNVSITPNPVVQMRGGAGIALAQLLASVGCRAVLVPQVGPQAMGALQRMGITVYTVQPGVPLYQALRTLGLVS